MVVEHKDARDTANDFIRKIAARADCLPDDPPDVVNLRELFQGRFDIWERVATGGQGRVYQASRVGDNTYERIAIKLLMDGPLASDQARHRFMSEIDLASRLDHPGIVPILESGEIADRYFFTMPFIYGAPIDDYALLHELSVRDRVSLIAKVARALVAAHLAGVIHRDLKPSNILVDHHTHEPYILDFGLAKELRQDTVADDPTSISWTGQVVGTLPYFSPEQAHGGSGRVDVRSDVYTLGLVLYRLLTARFPYDIDGDRDAVLHNIRHQDSMPLKKALASAVEAKRDREPDYISDSHTINDDLDRIVHKALHKEPELRYQSMADFADDLECYLRGEAVQAKADTVMFLLRKAVRRNKTMFVAAAVALLFVVGGLGLTALHYRREAKTAAVAQSGLNMGAFLTLGSSRRDAGRIKEAVTIFEAAIGVAHSSNSKDAVCKRQEYNAHHWLCEIHLRAKKPARAKSHCDSAIAIAIALSHEEPREPEWRRLLGSSEILRGRIEMSQGDYSKASTHLGVGIGILDELHSLGSSDAQYKKALVLGRRGKCFRKIKQFVAARTDYDDAHQILETYVAANADGDEFKIELSRIESRLAALCLSTRFEGSSAEALQWLESAKSRLSSMADSGRLHEHVTDISSILTGIRANETLARERVAKEASLSTGG